MWMIELNIAGQRFTREIPRFTRTSLRTARFRPLTVHWRVPQLRHPHAA